MQQAKYKEEDPETSGMIPVEIEGSFSGDYLQLVRFINTLERSKMFFDVDSVDLAGKHGTGPAGNHNSQLSAVGCLSETGSRKSEASHRAGRVRRDRIVDAGL